MESLWNLSAGQFTGAALALGALLMEGLTPDQQAQLGNLLMPDDGHLFGADSLPPVPLSPGTGGYPGTVGTAAPPAGGSGTVLCSPIPLRGRIWYTGPIEGRPSPSPPSSGRRPRLTGGIFHG